MAFSARGTGHNRIWSPHANTPSSYTLFVVLAATSFALAACENPVRGVGKDMQETGEAVEDTVQGNP